MYEELIKTLRLRAALWEKMYDEDNTLKQAADAIEELLNAAKAMHTWIFLHTGDEEAAYQECGLSDEMNVALGYGGKLTLYAKEET